MKEKNNETLLEIIEKNKLSLKNVKMFNGHDGIGLSCDLYINNKKVAYCFDDARGGEMEITPLTFIHRSELDNLNKILLSYPPYQFDGQLSDCEFNYTLEDVINHIVLLQEEEKELKKLSKKAIVYKTAEGETWSKSWGNLALAMLLAKKGNVGKEMIRNACQEIESRGNTILNKHYLQQLDINV